MNRDIARRLLVGVLAVEVIVPAIGIATFDPPRQYSWSMFVESSTTYRYVGADRAGRQADLDPAEVGAPWSDIHYGPQTPRLLCERHPDLMSITRFYDRERESVQPC